MKETSKTDSYIEYINSHILSRINYSKLQASYDTDMAYAKEVLNSLHMAMVKVYGSEYLDESIADDGFVVIPGIVCSKEAGDIALALLDIDLSSSGEHWGTTFLCKYGVIPQGGENKGPAVNEMLETFGPYDYCYTALIHHDHHVDLEMLPNSLKKVLADFQNHKPVLMPKNEPQQRSNSTNSNKNDKPMSESYEDDILRGSATDKNSSVIGAIRETEKAPKAPRQNKTSQKKPKPEI